MVDLTNKEPTGTDANRILRDRIEHVEYYRRKSIELEAWLKNIAFSASVYARKSSCAIQFRHLAKIANEAIDTANDKANAAYADIPEE